MAKRSSHSRKSPRPRNKPRAAGSTPPRAGGSSKGYADDDSPVRGRKSDIRLRQVPGQQVWEFVHPRCVRDRAEDLEEVRAMLDAGEDEIAMDELRWLLGGCSDFIEAHRLLGELALTAGDTKLARAHFGYGFDIGLAAIPPKGLSGPLPYARSANQSFFEVGKGLAWTFAKLEMPDRARDVLDTLFKLDPSDPLGVAAMREKLNPTTG